MERLIISNDKSSIRVVDVDILKVGAASAEIDYDRSMVIGGGILPRYASAREGELRASAVIIERDIKVCIVSCDVLALKKDFVDDVCLEIERKNGIPFENILICATHTHHAPTTVTIHGYEKEDRFLENVKKSILSAVDMAEERMDEATMNFWLGIESTVGQNSRLLLSDNTIYWYGPRDDAVRPTAPFDPDLPVITFKRKNGEVEALLFNHSTHNIGTRIPDACSPGFYGLAAQELESELGGTVIFLPGASGSTHNLELSADEMIIRIKNAVKEAFSESRPRTIQYIASAKREFEYHVRRFDEKKEDDAVTYYCNKRLENPGPVIEVFRKMRRELLKHQGEKRKTWIHIILLGDIALVGVPGELFTKLGIKIKRLSPFRYTYIIELANDWIGYIPDWEAYDLGGYQVWTGFHSYMERGTGEAIVEKAVETLSDLYPQK